MKEIGKRKQLSLQDYDYSKSGAYFVTICTHDRQHLFGEIVNGEMQMNDYGVIVETCWYDVPNHYPEIELDEFVVMPNHVHGIIIITDDDESPVGARHASPLRGKRHTLGNIVGSFKSAVTNRLKGTRTGNGKPIWQRNYYEHIIRNEKSLQRIQAYINTNPARWQYDKENSMCTGADEFDIWMTSQGTSRP